MNTKRLVLDALLVALYVVLSFVSINLGFIKLTFASFAIIVGALLYGWKDGLVIGMLGEFLMQLLTYGITVTTPLWALPAMARGLIIGLYAQKHNFDLNYKQTAIIVLISSLVVTTINSVVIWLDGIIYHYAVELTVGIIGLRYLNCIVMAAVYALLAPKTVALLKSIRPAGTADGKM